MQSINETENLTNNSLRSISRLKEDSIQAEVSRKEKEVGSIKPFVDSDAVFEIRKQFARYFLCEPNTAETHKNLVEKFGQSADLELQGRQFGANFIRELGNQLLVSPSVMNTAIVYLHRFYIYHPICLTRIEEIACVALHLACKLHNNPRPYRDFAGKLEDPAKRQTNPNVRDQFQDYFFMLQDFMIATFSFILEVENPSKTIEDSCFRLKISNSEFIKEAHQFAIMSLIRTTFCIRYPTVLIAAFSINMTLVSKGYKLPDSADGRPWYKFINENISQEMLSSISNEFMWTKEITQSPVKFDYSSTLNNIEKKRPSSVDEDPSLPKLCDEPPSKRHCPSSIHSDKSSSTEPSTTDEEGSSNRFNRFTNERSLKMLSESAGVEVRTTNSGESFLSNKRQTVSRIPLDCGPKITLPPQQSQNWLKAFSTVDDKNQFSAVDDKTQFSSKFIRSTIPLKIKPPPIKQEPPSTVDFSCLSVDIPEAYSVVQPKRRVTHYREAKPPEIPKTNIRQVKPPGISKRKYRRILSSESETSESDVNIIDLTDESSSSSFGKNSFDSEDSGSNVKVCDSTDKGFICTFGKKPSEKEYSMTNLMVSDLNDARSFRQNPYEVQSFKTNLMVSDSNDACSFRQNPSEAQSSKTNLTVSDLNDACSFRKNPFESENSQSNVKVCDSNNESQTSEEFVKSLVEDSSLSSYEGNSNAPIYLRTISPNKLKQQKMEKKSLKREKRKKKKRDKEKKKMKHKMKRLIEVTKEEPEICVAEKKAPIKLTIRKLIVNNNEIYSLKK